MDKEILQFHLVVGEMPFQLSYHLNVNVNAFMYMCIINNSYGTDLHASCHGNAVNNPKTLNLAYNVDKSKVMYSHLSDKSMQVELSIIRFDCSEIFLVDQQKYFDML